MNFPDKPKDPKFETFYGPFKNGDLAKKGYNKLIGGNYKYVEERDKDPVMYHHPRASTRGIWRDPTNALSTPIMTVHDNFINKNQEFKTLMSR